MNKGLFGWPEGRYREYPQQFGFPRTKRTFRNRPLPAIADTIGTSLGFATSFDLVMPPNLAAEDLLISSIRLSANNAPGIPAGWTTQGSGIIGTMGYATIWKIADGTELTTPQTVTSGISCLISALTTRVVNAGTPTWSIVTATNGATPLLASISYTLGGQLPSLALCLGTTSGSFSAANLSSFFDSGGALQPATAWEDFLINSNGVYSSWMAWYPGYTTALTGQQGVGTWTNFHWQCAIIPPLRARASVQR